MLEVLQDRDNHPRYCTCRAIQRVDKFGRDLFVVIIFLAPLVCVGRVGLRRAIPVDRTSPNVSLYHIILSTIACNAIAFVHLVASVDNDVDGDDLPVAAAATCDCCCCFYYCC